MHAAVMRSFGPPSVLSVESDVPLPPPWGAAPAPSPAAPPTTTPDRRPWPKPRGRSACLATAPPLALVKVAYCSVNPIDWKTRKGEVPRFAVANPKVIGGDLSGVIVALTPAALQQQRQRHRQQQQQQEQHADEPGHLQQQHRPFDIGDRVYALSGLQEFWRPYGAAAEYAAVPLACLAHAPATLSLRDAAAVPLAGMTAWQALAPAMPLRGKRVLVHAAAGGVGCFAVQIAKAQGAAAVHGTCGPRNASSGFLTAELGADAAIDYTRGPFEDDPLAAEGYDVVVDLIGGDYERRSLELLRRRARAQLDAWAEADADQQPPFVPRPYLAEVLNSGALREAQGDLLKGAAKLLANTAKGLAASIFDKRESPLYKLIVVRPEAAPGGLTELSRLIEQGKVRVFVEREFASLERIGEAHALVEGGHVRGKVVVRVGGGGGGGGE
jgi:NADPH:quinone reductase-like Zn-dependent oxidoreductase